MLHGRCLTTCGSSGLAVVADGEGVAERVGEVVALADHQMLLRRSTMGDTTLRNMKAGLTGETIGLAQTFLAPQFL